jgi:murein DD-endopeptidase MepM/ murein hydrolase activator NlpD
MKLSQFYTIMVIPEKEKGVKSFRIPKVVFNSFIFILVVFLAVLGILSYDYVKILRQVYENRHLSIENRQLKEQIQLFNMKLNTITDDIERIQQFEKKLRVITGYEQYDLTTPVKINHDMENHDHDMPEKQERKPNSIDLTPEAVTPIEKIKQGSTVIMESEEFADIRDLYERKIATNFGLITGYSYTKEWNNLLKQSFKLAKNFALFDYKYNYLRKAASSLETRVNNLDQFLLDRESFLRSTPTLIPARGWITSYYGPRMSHYSKRVKMHEGLDVGAPIGTPIVAPADGVVKIAGNNAGFGLYVEIDHGYGIETIYAHNSRLVVKKGQKVKRGDMIARLGNTGLSTGPHLHYEVRVNGTPVDPLYYILD